MVSSKTDLTIEINVFFYVGYHVSKWIFDIFGDHYIFGINYPERRAHHNVGGPIDCKDSACIKAGGI